LWLLTGKCQCLDWPDIRQYRCKLTVREKVAYAMTVNKYGAAIFTVLVLALTPVSAESSSDDTSAAKSQALNNYAAAEVAGKQAEATKSNSTYTPSFMDIKNI